MLQTELWLIYNSSTNTSHTYTRVSQEHLEIARHSQHRDSARQLLLNYSIIQAVHYHSYDGGITSSTHPSVFTDFAFCRRSQSHPRISVCRLRRVPSPPRSSGATPHRRCTRKAPGMLQSIASLCGVAVKLYSQHYNM